MCLDLQCDERVLQEVAVGFTDVGTGELSSPACALSWVCQD